MKLTNLKLPFLLRIPHGTLLLHITPGSPSKFLMAAFVRLYAQKVTAEIYPVQPIVSHYSPKLQKSNPQYLTKLIFECHNSWKAPLPPEKGIPKERPHRYTDLLQKAGAPFSSDLILAVPKMCLQIE